MTTVERKEEIERECKCGHLDYEHAKLPDSSELLECLQCRECEKFTCVCGGSGWVCENHPNKPAHGNCCGGAGMPCECNKTIPPWNFVGRES